jgi:hypothetical protein
MTIAAVFKAVRLLHRYIGIFFAPSILFFAVTGGLQMFGLHETSRGSSYVPPAILVHLSQLHKKGTVYLPPRKAGPPAPIRPEAPKPASVPLDSPPHNSLPMKLFFAATALALVVSTCTDIVMAWRYVRRKSMALVTLAAGIVVPVILLLV